MAWQYISALNAQTAPFPVGQIPKLDVKEVLPRDADRAVSPPPIPANGFRAGASARYEYVTGHRGIFFSQYIKALGPFVDDLSKELGDDIYERMLTDYQVDSCLKVWKVGVLGEGGRFQSAISDEKHPKYIAAQKVCQFVEWQAGHMTTPLFTVIYEMLDGMVFGNKVAEIVMEVADYEEVDSEGNAAPPVKRWTWESFRTKARGATSFLVDAYMRTLGVLAQIPGLPYPIVSGQLVSDPATIPNLLPEEKFLVFSYNPKDCDPRGRSGARSAYTPWWAKMQTIHEFMKYLAMYAIPSFIGEAPEGSVPKVPVDADGNPTGQPATTPEQDISDTMAKLRGGATVCFPPGTKIDPVPVAAAAAESVFLQEMEWSDRAIAKSMLGQTLATEEGQHMARAAAEVHENTMELGFLYPKQVVQNMMKKAIKSLVRFNFGDEAARDLCPDYVLTGVNRSDWAMWSGIAIQAYSSGYLTYEQKLWLDEKLGLPKTTITKDDQQIPGNTPAVAVFQQIMARLQAAEQQRQAAQQPGMVPQGVASPAHPQNQQQPAQEAQAA